MEHVEQILCLSFDSGVASPICFFVPPLLVLWASFHISFSGAQNFLKFQPNLCPWQLFKEGTHQSVGPFCHAFFQPPKLWPGEDFLNIFSNQKCCLVIGYMKGTTYFAVSLICACGFCSNRATVKAFWPISPHLFSNPHSFGLEWTFWTFSVLKMNNLSLAI